MVWYCASAQESHSSSVKRMLECLLLANLLLRSQITAVSFSPVHSSAIGRNDHGKAGVVVKSHGIKGKTEKSWEAGQRGEVKEGAGGTERGWGEGREVGLGGGGVGGSSAWVEDLPVNCVVASQVIGARLSERAWNSTPRGSARVHTLSVQDPCPSASARQPCTTIYTATGGKTHVYHVTHAWRPNWKATTDKHAPVRNHSMF